MMKDKWQVDREFRREVVTEKKNNLIGYKGLFALILVSF
jgi:hypothetical protein